jgi:PAS domain S-box-containing protein
MPELDKLPLAADQFLSQLTQHSPDVIYTLSRSGRFTYISPAFEKITGWSTSEWLGKRFYPLIHSADLPKSILKFAWTISGKTPAPFEIRILTKKGTYVIGQLHVSPLKNKGRTIGVLGVGKDLTAWKEQERKYLVSTNQLSVIVQNVADAITVQDPTGKLILVNQAAAESTGYASPAEMIADPLGWIETFELLDEELRPLNLENLPGRRALVTKRDTQRIVCSVNKATQEKRWMQIKARPVLDHKKNIVMVINIVHDFTDRYLMDQRKDTFINMISHELKTPLTSIFLYLELIRKKIARKENAAPLIEKINEPAQRLLRLINEFLDLSRIQTGKLNLNYAKFRLDTLITDQIEIIQSTAPNHTLVYTSKTPLPLEADKDHMTQVITNLLDNAVKYSPNGGEIEITTSKRNKQYLVTVKDSGVGVPREYRKQIFERLFQVAENRTHQEGLGMGLYISSQIVRKHGGKMWVRNNRQGGSTFCFTIPAKPSTAPTS